MLLFHVIAFIGPITNLGKCVAAVWGACLGYRFLSSQEVRVGTLFVLAITVGEVFIGRQIAAGIGYR